MKANSGTVLIHNGQVVDGTGAPPVLEGAVIIEDEKITYVGPKQDAPQVPEDATLIDANGGTIMPGLVEAHFHPTYFNVAALEDLDFKYPVEYVTILASCMARLAIECGYTSARSGGSLFNIDVWLKKASVVLADNLNSPLPASPVKIGLQYFVTHTKWYLHVVSTVRIRPVIFHTQNDNA